MRARSPGLKAPIEARTPLTCYSVPRQEAGNLCIFLSLTNRAIPIFLNSRSAIVLNYMLVALILLSSGGFAQGDTLNQTSVSRKKTGLWVVYLDEAGTPTREDAAVFIGYERYDDGYCIWPFGKPECTKHLQVESDGKKGEAGHPLPINGNIKLYDRRGRLVYDSDYANGYPLLLRSYRYNRKGHCITRELLDFTMPYRGTAGTFGYQLYNSKEELVSRGYFRQGNKGWRIYEE